jgi:hypothetical protein
MSTATRLSGETELAKEIIGALDADAVRICSDDRRSIRFAVRSAAMKLRSIVLSRASLRKLLSDPLAAIKIEYLKRDLRRAAANRIEYAYPRPGLHGRTDYPDLRKLAVR